MSEIVKAEKDLPAEDYAAFLEDIKSRVASAQIKAALSVNRALVLLYWQIGRDILERQAAQGWGAKVIDNLAKDLRNAFPEMKGFSPRNLKYMRAFAEAYPETEFVQQVAAQIPWFTNCLILDKTGDAAEREWYIKQTIEQGWSRNVLALQIDSKLFERQGKAVTNFEKTLPVPQSELAQDILKSPYNFDFLGLGKKVLERDVENALLANLKKFFIELGKGFAFVGNQYPLEIGGQDYFLDLLFYHLKLRCFVVIDLKIDEFKPEYAGKMNFYLSAVDDLLRHESDAPSIGLILCRDKNKIIVEYSLRDQTKPIGVSDYKLLPDELQESLPTAEEIESVIGEETIVSDSEIQD
jgi:predicted nuclease of restriction endonuclease-like (RecB) superfamily